MASLRRILSVSSSRADIGILGPVWNALAIRPNIELHVLMTGMHRSDSFATPPVPPGAVSHIGGQDLGGSSARLAERAMTMCAQASAELFERFPFDCVLLMGDRLDMFPSAFAALPYNLPLAHIHGGELSYGVIDERVRHAITKMAHLHFVSGVDAAARVARMGEEPWRIHVTGAPGLDTLREAPSLPPGAFARALNLPFAEGFFLVTVHPETNSRDSAGAMRAVLEALDRCAAPVLLTAPNSDPGGDLLRTMIENFLPGRPQVAFRNSLGSDLYPSALRHAAAMVGNSSSGLIEAGFFGLPVVNIGNRQQGRISGSNVCHVQNDSEMILTALQRILDERTRYPSRTPYGDGRAGERIAAVLADLPDRGRMLYKEFHDGESPVFVAPWEDR
jgi:UDP-hydrolysing UDP-N-acetyl-D-glucosamine 2-epimerase